MAQFLGGLKVLLTGRYEPRPNCCSQALALHIKQLSPGKAAIGRLHESSVSSKQGRGLSNPARRHHPRCSIQLRTPQRPGEAMIAVIFEVVPAPGRRDDYLAVAAELKPLLEAIDGFISVERFQSLSDPGKILSLSFFRDQEAVKAWRNTIAHRRAQAAGRGGIFSGYRLRIAAVIRDYGLHDRDQAPDDSRAAHRSLTRASVRVPCYPAIRASRSLIRITASRAAASPAGLCRRKLGHLFLEARPYVRLQCRNTAVELLLPAWPTLTCLVPGFTQIVRPACIEARNGELLGLDHVLLGPLLVGPLAGMGIATQTVDGWQSCAVRAALSVCYTSFARKGHAMNVASSKRKLPAELTVLGIFPAAGAAIVRRPHRLRVDISHVSAGPSDGGLQHDAQRLGNLRPVGTLSGSLWVMAVVLVAMLRRTWMSKAQTLLILSIVLSVGLLCIPYEYWKQLTVKVCGLERLTLD